MTTSKSNARGRGERWWARLIERQRRSGKSVKELCAAAGVSEQSFYWWRRKLSHCPNLGFTEVELCVVNECEIRLKCGRSVVVRGAVSAESLRTVLVCAEEVSL